VATLRLLLRFKKRAKMPFVYIGLGSNKGDKVKNIREALKHLEKKIRVQKVSSFYLTEPVGIKGEWFINCALEGKTEEEPREALNSLLQIEREMGRIRMARKEARIIDLDLLLYEEKIIHKNDLTLPHPRLHKRKFVLIPLLEINPHLYHPVLKKPLKEILKDLKDSHQVKKI
jgi:2-amino-4-hydroxy-6-hydroxymethyldihydropteridine diphosphokinase